MAQNDVWSTPSLSAGEAWARLFPIPNRCCATQTSPTLRSVVWHNSLAILVMSINKRAHKQYRSQCAKLRTLWRDHMQRSRDFHVTALAWHLRHLRLSLGVQMHAQVVFRCAPIEAERHNTSSACDAPDPTVHSPVVGVYWMASTQTTRTGGHARAFLHTQGHCCDRSCGRFWAVYCM